MSHISETRENAIFYILKDFMKETQLLQICRRHRNLEWGWHVTQTRVENPFCSEIILYIVKKNISG